MVMMTAVKNKKNATLKEIIRRKKRKKQSRSKNEVEGKEEEGEWWMKTEHGCTRTQGIEKRNRRKKKQFS